MGKGYIVEHCISLFNKRAEERLYRIYMTDMTRLIFNFIAGKGNAISERYADWIDNKPKKPEKTGDEIAAEIIAKFNLKQKDKDDE